MIEDTGVSVRLILGNAYCANAPATMLSVTFYADMKLEPGSRLPMPDDHENRRIYVVDGSLSVARQDFDAGRMMVFRPGDRITVATSDRGAQRMILGGATFPGPRYIWWNFVASSQERIKAAKAEWRAGNGARGASICRPMTAASISRCRIDRRCRNYCRDAERAPLDQMTGSRVGRMPEGDDAQ